MLPGTWSFKYKRKPYRTIRKFKARYYVIGDTQKRFSPKPLNSYYPAVKEATLRLIPILQCIIGLQSQSIDFTNSFDKADIPSGKPVFIEISRYFKNNGLQHDVVLKLKKCVYGQAKAALIQYEKLQNNLFERVFVMSMVDPCLFMS